MTDIQTIRMTDMCVAYDNLLKFFSDSMGLKSSDKLMLFLERYVNAKILYAMGQLEREMK